MLNYLQFTSNKSHNFIHRVNGVSYKIHIRYDAYNSSYYMNIDKNIGGLYTNIISNIRLTTGVNLLLQYQHFNLGDLRLIPYKDTEFDKIPNTDTIVQDYAILWEHN